MRRFPVLAGIAAAQLAFAVSVWAECAWDRVELRGDWGTAVFDVEVADTPETRARGLMHRESLPRRGGMLFIFESAGPVSFWMKNTRIPLDMLFFDHRGILSGLEENTEPFSTQAIQGGDGVLSVLEINAGLARLYGIGPGTEIRHPGLANSHSAWRCESLE